MKTLFFLFAALVSITASAQDKAGAVTEEQVASYQSDMQTGCRERGRQRGGPVTYVDSFCSCMIKTLRQEIPFSDWQKAYLFSRKRQDIEESKVMAPYLPKVQAACKNNAP